MRLVTIPSNPFHPKEGLALRLDFEYKISPRPEGFSIGRFLRTKMKIITTRPGNQGWRLWMMLILSAVPAFLQFTILSAEKLEAIDMNRAQQIHQRVQKGEPLSS